MTATGRPLSAAVVVGSGSAGRRHALALHDQAPELALTIVRRAGHPGDQDELARSGAQFVDDLERALIETPQVGVVAGPAPYHAPAARRLLAHGAAVLVEKPLAVDVAAASTIATPDQEARVLVGYHLRFGDVLPAMSRVVTAGGIGTPCSFELEVGQHLSSWRPSANPLDSVSARAELGGGVLLELSHELDALRCLLGTEVDVVLSARLRTDGAPTDGRVETVADLELQMTDGACGTVHLDMTSEPPFRRWKVCGSDGALHADLLDATVELEARDGTRTTVLQAAPGERDRAERRLIDHLLGLARDGGEPRCTIDDGLRALEIVEAARRSAASGGPVTVRGDEDSTP